MKTLYVSAFTALLAFSCTENKTISSTAAKEKDIIPSTLDSVFIAKAPVIEEAAKQKILRTYSYHEDEVTEAALKKNWWALLKTQDGLQLKKSSVSFDKVHDPIADEEGQKTGWKVDLESKEKALLLMTDIPQLKEGIVESIKLDKNTLSRDYNSSFEYKGKKYTLYASGDKVNPDEGLAKYQLFLTTTKDNKVITQCIDSTARGEGLDCIPELLFIGDIDMDGYLDLIIDVSNHYNAEMPTLYLSKPASKNELLKIVGQHTSLGC